MRRNSNHLQPAFGGISRRGFMQAAGAVAAAPLLHRSAWAQQSVLPLNTPGLEHLDILVPDVDASARFYMRVFDSKLHTQPFQGGSRHFVLLGDLPDDRQVGYIAIGDARGRPTQIGHYCAQVYDYGGSRAAIMQALADAGYAEPPAQTRGDAGRGGAGRGRGGGGGFGMLEDPDGLQLQLLGVPAGLVTAAVPATLELESGSGLVKPVGFDHVLLQVADVEASLPYYRLFYGEEDRRDGARVWFQIVDTRLALEPVPAGSAPTIAHYCIKVEPFDRGAVTGGLTALGAEVLPSPDETDVVRFRDLDGITVELLPVQD